MLWICAKKQMDCTVSKQGRMNENMCRCGCLSGYSEVVVVGAGADAVDFKLISLLKKGEHAIVVTQDYARVVSHADGCACTYGHMTSTATLSAKCDAVWQLWRLGKMPLRSINRENGTRMRT